MKVSIIVSDLSSQGAGRWGGAVRPFLLAKALKKIDCEVEIVGFSRRDKEGLSSSPDVPIIAIPTHPSYPKFLASVPKLFGHITGDVIYAYKVKLPSLGIALLHKIKSGCPVIVDIDDWELSWNGGDEYQYKPSIFQLLKDILEPGGALQNTDHSIYLKWAEKLVAKADAVTIHTRFLQSRFGGIMVPNGKDTTLFDPGRYEPHQSRVNYGLEGYRILMFPGAPRPYKGVEDVLMALDLIDQSDLKLVIVGGSPYDNYDDILMEKWGRWIIKLPNFPAEKMPEIVAAAHVIVVPQRDHPATRAQFPLKLTDGMAMAKPVLASRVGDIPEILGDTGYLVEPNSPEQIADTLKLIFEDLDVANHRGLQARQRCVELYSIEAMANVLSNVMDQVM
ncbi:glycosyltransferase family 4 protein [Arthrospira platensis NCB002]|uniref:Glycosyl transferase n=1 Tax=Limnospira platensis NIES-46 TaxID=1236695 RepID=A0A5M3TEM6_LIMPL|nr:MULTISPECIES: glycosyltransferase family 4 protein [Arthrospira]MDF2207604.1 glycosyltransferase family 4 protein [Arthrospira platensis NCB002]BAI93140.1 probable glycosyl transferase [Arthrospira platensis NIES-39]TVU53778.1 MAG: glycosyltransferase [Arthrospira sp. PLM2.Bin9]BDT15383.1 probable glycosyl transferase [Arthrospira platensis NIES-39]GCE96416.1 putative glycosyl transferase [Arthrospira platensis NIES-46]